MKLAATVLAATTIVAQGPLLDDAPVTPTAGYTDENGSWVPPSRDRAPDTDSCQRSLVPPEPVSTSERRGDATPAPLPQSYTGPCGVSAAAGFQVDPKVVASSWTVVDIDSGEVVAMKDPHGRYRPASLIKVLLALVAIDELDLDAVVTVSAESASQEGSAAGIGEDGTYTVRDLLHGLILASGNDCAHALAQALGGDSAALLKVNQRAQELGMADTRATTYSGLDSPGMSTSAWDMALAYRAAFNNPTFAGIADTESYPFPGYGDQPGFELWNDNKLYLNDPEGIGGKTGYTDDANHTFAGAVDHDGRRLLAVLLDTSAYDMRPWEQAQKLLEAAYPIAAGNGVARLEAAGAETAATATPQPGASGAENSTGAAAGSADSTERADRSDAADAGRNGWLPAAIVAGVLVLAGLGIWLNARTSRGGRGARD